MTKTADLLELEPQIAPVWRNLIFLKNGRTLFGYHSFSSQEDAAAAIPPSEVIMRNWLRQHSDKRVVRKKDGSHLFYVREYSHAIPVPWRSR